MKAGWKLIRFGDICVLKKGRKPNLLASQGPSDMPYLVAKYLRGAAPMEFAAKQDRNSICVSSNEIIIICDGSNSGETFIGYEGVLSSTMAKVVHSSDLHTKFLIFYLESLYEKFNAAKTGSAIPHLDLLGLRNEQLPIPSAKEQKRIVTLLDEAFAHIATAKANAEQNLQNARALFESHLQSVFTSALKTGELATLADLATDIGDGDHMPPPKAPIGVPFITIRNIAKDTREIDFSSTFMVSREYFDKLKPGKRPRKGDVLYTVTGSFGIPVLLKDDKEFCFQRHIGLVRPKPNVDSNWLYYLLMSPQILKQANDGATGTAQKTVSLKQLRGYQVPLISLASQRSTAAKLEELSTETQRLESLYQQKISALDALKKSLLHQAFSGQL